MLSVHRCRSGLRVPKIFQHGLSAHHARRGSAGRDVPTNWPHVRADRPADVAPHAPAKQAPNYASQAILPLRGKILNVASSGKDKLARNQQLANLAVALGCGTGAHYRDEDLRYGKVIVMTDADGAPIASLLITFFYKQMPQRIDHGHLCLAETKVEPGTVAPTHCGERAGARASRPRTRTLGVARR